MEFPPALALSATVGLMILLWSSTAEAKKVPAIYVFGDSTADVGNNNHLPNGSRANFPHNGIDYPGGIPTGRFSNGYNFVDYLAMMMGFKESPPAYFSDDEKAKLERGVNFASGGSGVFDSTGQNRSFPMSKQITFFEKEVDRLVQSKGKGAAKLFLSKSIFIFSVANNDLPAFYQKFGFQNSSTDQNARFISSITSQFKHQLERIYDLGGRRFAVIGTISLGCLPAVRRINPDYTCIDDLNALSELFNQAMGKEVRSLTSTHEGMKYSFVNSNNIYLTVSANPQRYGFKVLNAACCGSGVLRAETACLPNATYCSNRNEYFSWDAVHQTQAAHHVTAKFAFGGSSRFTTPINIEKLIHN